MTARRPADLSEWAAYVASLPADRLVAKAQAANSVAFTSALGEDGFTPDEIETVLILFARRLAASGLHVPSQGWFAWRDLAARVPPIAIDLPPPGPPPDDEDVDD